MRTVISVVLVAVLMGCTPKPPPMNHMVVVFPDEGLAFQLLTCDICGNVQSFFLSDQVREREWMEQVGLRTH